MGGAAAKQHRLPTAKFRLRHDHLRQLDLARPEQLHQPLPIPRRVLEPVHSRAYHHDDRFGRLALRGTGKPLRDRMVLEACLRGIPAATVTGSVYDALTALMRRGAMAWCSGRPRRRACR